MTDESSRPEGVKAAKVRRAKGAAPDKVELPAFARDLEMRCDALEALVMDLLVELHEREPGKASSLIASSGMLVRGKSSKPMRGRSARRRQVIITAALAPTPKSKA